MKVLVLGANGLLGQSFKRKYKKNSKFDFWPSSKNQRIDVANNFNEFFVNSKIQDYDVIINCIAMTDLEAQELDPVSCYNINTIFPIKLAQKLNQDQLLLQYSTDQFYSSKPGFLSKETSTIRLTNTYSKSKYLAEDILNIHDNTIIIRTNFISGNILREKHFISWLYMSALMKKDIILFTDYYTSSIDIFSLLSISIKLIDKQSVGIFNVGSNIGYSKFEYGSLLLQRLKLCNTCIKPGSLLDLNENKISADRNTNLSMDCSKLKEIIRVDLPDLSQIIENVIKEKKLVEKHV